MTIVILDHSPTRMLDLYHCCKRSLIDPNVSAFHDVKSILAWLTGHLDKAQLICLDDDLGIRRRRYHKSEPNGNGLEVAAYLATRKPTCPVIIHAADQDTAAEMAKLLDDAGWTTEEVSPSCDPKWIRNEWIPKVQELLASERVRQIN